MSYVIATPELMTSAASDLATIGSNVSAAHIAAAAPTTSVIPAAADEVSASIAHLFSQHAAGYQALAGQAAAFQEQFVQHLTAGAFSYADIEATIASFLQNLNVSADSFVAQLTGSSIQDIQAIIAGLPAIIIGVPSLIIAAPFLLLFLLVIFYSAPRAPGGGLIIG